MVSQQYLLLFKYHESGKKVKSPMLGYREWIKARSLFDLFCLSKSFNNRLSSKFYCELVVRNRGTFNL